MSKSIAYTQLNSTLVTSAISNGPVVLCPPPRSGLDTASSPAARPSHSDDDVQPPAATRLATHPSSVRLAPVREDVLEQRVAGGQPHPHRRRAELMPAAEPQHRAGRVDPPSGAGGERALPLGDLGLALHLRPLAATARRRGGQRVAVARAARVRAVRPGHRVRRPDLAVRRQLRERRRRVPRRPGRGRRRRQHGWLLLRRRAHGHGPLCAALAARLGPAAGPGRPLLHAFLVVDSAQHPIIQLQQQKTETIS